MIRFSRKMNAYKHFFLKLLALLIFVLILDFLIGNILRHYYFKKQRDYNFRTGYVIDSTKADLLIFGSSRASHHYQPDTFGKRLNLTCYNAGRDGEFLLYHYAILKAVLKRYLPKMIVLDIIPGEFAKSNDSYDRLSFLLAYYRNHPEMRSVIELRSRLEKVKLLSSIYPYNSLVLSIITQNFILPPEKKKDIDGYLPLSGKWSESIKYDNTPIKYEVDSVVIKTYKLFIQDCLNSKVKVYIVCSPFFRKSTHIDYSIKLAEEIAKRYQVNFFDYSLDSTFINRPDFFDDPAHLNNEGAALFSMTVAERIALDKNRN